jgi:hypothetical protein
MPRLPGGRGARQDRLHPRDRRRAAVRTAVSARDETDRIFAAASGIGFNDGARLSGAGLLTSRTFPCRAPDHEGGNGGPANFVICMGRSGLRGRAHPALLSFAGRRDTSGVPMQSLRETCGLTTVSLTIPQHDLGVRRRTRIRPEQASPHGARVLTGSVVETTGYRGFGPDIAALACPEMSGSVWGRMGYRSVRGYVLSRADRGEGHGN